MAEYDLTPVVAEYLDVHLIFPLLEFLADKKIYTDTEIFKARLKIIKYTNLADFRIEIFESMYPDQEVPKELFEKRAEVVATIDRLSQAAQPLIKACQHENTVVEVQNLRDPRQLMEYLLEHFDNVQPGMVEDLYTLGKAHYDGGHYRGASQCLYLHRLLIAPSDKNYLNNLWGKLASEILTQNWETALDELTRLREYIDSNVFGTQLQSLQHHAWFIHWSLFVFFNHSKGIDIIVELFLYQQPYLNAIQTVCPHILRYLACAIIVNKSKRSAMRELVNVIQQESYTYRDPITEFVECIFINFDFDGAQAKLKECETLLDQDFFLVACKRDFVENARLFIFENFCRIHECISISMLADKLNMTPAAAEVWIVNLIRNVRLDAKIDSKLGHVIMGTQAVSPYQQLIDKTQALYIRTNMQVSNLEQRLAPVDTGVAPHSSWGTQHF